MLEFCRHRTFDKKLDLSFCLSIIFFMYVDTSQYTKKGKRYTRHLLRESYREGSKVKKRTIASLNHCTDEEIAAIKLALKYKGNLSSLKSSKEVKVNQGKSIGALLALQAACDQAGLKEGLGDDEQGKVALWQVFARVLDQGSRCSALRLLDNHLGRELLGLPDLNPYRLYKNLEWLYKHQEEIEQKLWQQRSDERMTNLFLYDVTSSYLEGMHNELADYGYNRDKKSGKKQIVIGLLTDNEGDPIAVRVFKGNTSDGKTVKTQIDALRNQFKVSNVTMVGDRAMFKLPQIEQMPEDFNYISALTKPEIRSLLKSNVIQLGLFDKDLCEIEHEGVRYILRCNPLRAREMKASRKDKLESVKELIEQQNTYLREHTRATEEAAIKKVKAKAKKLKISDWVTITAKDRAIRNKVDMASLEEAGRLDGCYCLRTDLTAQEANKEMVNDRYGDLQRVEAAFRTMKQSHLELRPIYLRRQDHTRGHVFVVMLAYLLQRQLQRAWKDIDRTVQEGLDLLSTLTTTILSIGGQEATKIPQPNAVCRELLTQIGAKVPQSI